MSTRRLASLLLFANIVIGLFYFHIYSGSNDPMRSNFPNDGLVDGENFTITTQALSSLDGSETRKMVDNTSSTLIIERLNFFEPYNFTLNPIEMCNTTGQTGRKLTLVILVCSAIANFKQRQAVRETWGALATSGNSTDSVRLGFLLGATNNSMLQQDVEKESRIHGDLIQQNFIDSYQNLTFKSIMLLKWVSTYCPNVHYVLKTDDDMYVNVPNLIKALSKVPVKSNVMYGVLFQRAKPNRNSLAKWYVPKSQFRADIFPDYLSGTAYVISRDSVPRLLEASSRLPFLVMEDVFITGLCASEAGVKRYGMKGFAYWKREATGCAFRDVITGHHVSIYDMRKITSELQKKPLVCRLSKRKYHTKKKEAKFNTVATKSNK